jgi:integration host factor subunit alpha
MQKKAIAQRIHQEAGIPEEQAVSLLDWILELFKTTLQQGEPISIFNFGVFTVRSKASRNGRNPITGQPLIISSRRVVTFHASPRLKAEVSAVQAEAQDAEGLPTVKPSNLPSLT